MVSLRQTSLKYRGKKAETYDAIRTKQARWTFENETVARWLRDLKPAVVLDCPVGTGRFIPYYADISIREFIGVDISEEMLALARKKIPRVMKQHCTPRLEVGDATKHDCVDRRVDMTVCVRFLDLIDEEAMRAVMEEMARVSRKHIILTIRFGDRYTPKSNTAEHDRKKFMALVKRLGFAVRESRQFREGSWHVLLLERTR